MPSPRTTLVNERPPARSRRIRWLAMAAMITIALASCLQAQPPSIDTDEATTQADTVVLGLTLIDADTDQPIPGFDPMASGAVIDYAALGTQNLSIRANTNPVKVGSVRFMLDGVNVRIENYLPYAIEGDSSSGTDFHPISPALEPGTHTVSAIPYSESNGQGTAGATHTITFDIAGEEEPPPPSFAVVSFTLIDTDTNSAISGFDPIPAGAVIAYSAIGTQNVSIRANTDPSVVGSVRFNLNGANVRIENIAPYAIYGDGNNGTTYNAIDPPLAEGSYTLTAVPYSESNGQGDVGLEHTRSFDIVLDEPATNEPPVAQDDEYQVEQGGTLSVGAPGVLGNDTDTEGGSLTATLDIPPTFGTLTLDADGSFSYTHDGGAATYDAFTYTASDGVNTSVAATVGITVTASAFSVTSFSLVDADTDAVVPGFESLSEGAVIDYDALGTQNLSIRANTSPGQVGSVRFTLDGTDVRIENSLPYAIYGDSPDGTDYQPIDPPLAEGMHTVTATPYSESNAQGDIGQELTRSFEIVSGGSGGNALPVANDDAYNVNRDGTLDIAAPGVLGNDTDGDGDTLSATLVTSTTAGALTLNTDGSFAYAPDATATTDAFTYTASDGSGTSNTATVTITIDDSNVSVASFTLIDTNTNTPISGFDPIPDGATIDYETIGTQNLSIRANTSPATVGSVRFSLDGSDVRIENIAPYAIYGDGNDGATYNPITPPLPGGMHSVTATPYTEGSGQGTAGAPLTRSFEILASGSTGGGCTPSPSQFEGMSISPLACNQVKVFDPYALEWDENEGAVEDAAGIGTGFTMILPTTKGTGFIPGNVTTNVSMGALDVFTTSGLKYTSANTQDNALGVGLDLPNKALRLSATILDPPSGTGSYQQAGLWFGISEDDYVKLVVISTPQGPGVQVLKEELGQNTGSDTFYITLPIASVTLSLVLDPVAETVTAYFQTGTGNEILLEHFTGVPSSWFSKDAAGIDINLGTRSFGGIFTSHRNGGTPLTYRFGEFSVSEASGGGEPPPPPPGSTIDFETWRFDGVDFPTAMEWGPDDRLYVTNVGGAIYGITIDHATRTVTDIDTYTVLGSRTVLGLAIDPDSTPDNVILWVSHSSSSLSSGEANSGVMTRLSGSSFSTRQDVITGLPRAIANHAPNEIEFGPDGKLYIALGGNTGAGAANDGTSEFGPRPEQPLSAALLVADVKAAGFDGTCRSQIDPDGSQMDATGISATDIPCDVEVYASGLRNSYDFAFHSNGNMYATDNGLGVEGTFPELVGNDLDWQPGDGCEGMIVGSTAIGQHNPGSRTDLLLRVQRGDYFGHPNPSRDECVFFGGNPTSSSDFPIQTASGEPQQYMDTGKYAVGIDPEPNWTVPMFALGKSKSANGIIEYRSDAFCGALKGDLLITYYSSGDQIRRVRLTADGNAVLGDETLIRSTSGTGGLALSNPLPITQDPLGRIYVGEFGGGGQIAVFDPIGPSCWQSTGVADLPENLLDAGGTAIGDRLYTVAGKTSVGPQRTLWIYDAATNAWTRGRDLPTAYPAVENPAVTTHNGDLYVFGGSTGPFSGATSAAARYDPETDMWTMLSAMPVARGGPTAQVLGGKAYVVGGMDGAGTSMQSMSVYDLGSGAWSVGPSMATPRDNPGSAVLDGDLYVFGGRTRNNASFPSVSMHSSIEVFDPSTGTWSSAAPMPTGRRAMTVTVVDDLAVVMGGEEGPDGSAFAVVEAYDPSSDSWFPLPIMPTGRHGAVAGRIGNGIFVAGGGPSNGSSYTSDVDVFRYR